MTSGQCSDEQSNRTWDEYTSELESGHLSWTPVHESEMFWRENATKLNDRDHAYLKYVFSFLPLIACLMLLPRQLVKLLNDSPDATVLAVSSHDLGQYVKYYQPGKK